MYVPGIKGEGLSHISHVEMDFQHTGEDMLSKMSSEIRKTQCS